MLHCQSSLSLSDYQIIKREMLWNNVQMHEVILEGMNTLLSLLFIRGYLACLGSQPKVAVSLDVSTLLSFLASLSFHLSRRPKIEGATVFEDVHSGTSQNKCWRSLKKVLYHITLSRHQPEAPDLDLRISSGTQADPAKNPPSKALDQGYFRVPTGVPALPS